MLIYIQVVLISNQPKQSKAMSIYKRIEELHITLPPVATPAAAYVPFVRTGNLVFLSGHISKNAGRVWTGQLGLTLQTEEGKAAARAVAIDLLGTLHAAVGDLNKVTRIVKVMSLVNSSATFTEQHLVTNGCSELLGQVFGEKGVHARSAFGVAQLPFGACVEIELIAECA
jgi:enamine deaminase RidA (YjgF/YER057c/UK114 family)